MGDYKLRGPRSGPRNDTASTGRPGRPYSTGKVSPAMVTEATSSNASGWVNIQ